MTSISGAGATTVGGTLAVARAAGIRWLATGGLGGVHRGFPAPPDVSADLAQLARTPALVVSAGGFASSSTVSGGRETVLAGGSAVGETLETVQYRGVLPILADMRDGKIPATVNTLTSLLPPHRGKRVRILLTTGGQRLKAAPNIPTATELGFPRLDMEEWFGFFVAPKTPQSTVADLNDTLRRVMEDPEMVGLMSPLGLTVKTSTPEELTALIGGRQTGITFDRARQAVDRVELRDEIGLHPRQPAAGLRPVGLRAPPRPV